MVLSAFNGFYGIKVLPRQDGSQGTVSKLFYTKKGHFVVNCAPLRCCLCRCCIHTV